MIHSEKDFTEDLLQKKRELEKQQQEIDEQLKECRLTSQQKALDQILNLMDTYEIDLYDIAIAARPSKKIEKKSQSKKEEKPKLPQPPEGKKYFNPETNKSWSGKGPLDDSIRYHSDPNSLLVDK